VEESVIKVGEFWWPDHDKSEHKAIAELDELDEFLTLVPLERRSVCVQAGGNVGVWPKYLCGQFNLVYTFEPNWENFECLCRNTEGFDNLYRYQAALTNDPGPVSLVGDEYNCGAWQIEQSDWDTIPALCLDSFNLPRVDVIILDVEGMEWNVLLGAMNTLKRCKPIIMVEDKGCSVKYGMAKDGIVDAIYKVLKYRCVMTINGGRDKILMPTDATDLA
jgi:FkbM family methyltransferase